MEIEESEHGATPEELVEFIEGMFLLLTIHKLWELPKGIKDDETGVNLYDRAMIIYKKLHPELDAMTKMDENEQKTGKNG